MDGSQISVSLWARCSSAATVPIKTQSIIWIRMKYPTLYSACVCLCECVLVDSSYKNTLRSGVVNAVIYHHCVFLLLLMHSLLGECLLLQCFCTKLPACHLSVKRCQHNFDIFLRISCQWRLGSYSFPQSTSLIYSKPLLEWKTSHFSPETP